MNKNFITILQQLVAEQGKEALLNPARCKAFLADYTRGDYKKESRLLLQALEAGVQKAIITTVELEICKLQQARVLHEEHFLTAEAAADVVDTLALVLRGEAPKTQAEAPKVESAPQTKPAPMPDPAPVVQAPPPLPTVQAKKKGNAVRNLMVIAGVVLLSLVLLLVLINLQNRASNSNRQSVKTLLNTFIEAAAEEISDGDFNYFDNTITKSTEEIRLNPNEIMAYIERGGAYLMKKQYDMAIRDYDAAIRLVPEASFILIRGLIYLMNDQDDTAMRDFNEAIRLDPNHYYTYFFRGLAYLMKDQNEMALKDFDNAIRLDPNLDPGDFWYAWVYASRGLAYRQLGQRNQAIQDLEKAISLYPNLDWARKELREIRGY
jgi:tetratricopeptide (TPR) repeat protein